MNKRRNINPLLLVDTRYSIDLSLAKIHLRMLRLELAQQILLLLIIASGQTSLLLSLIVHHFLDHASCLAVQVGEVGGLGGYFGDVDARSGGDDVSPPFHFVRFVEVDLNGLCRVWVRGERPG